MKRTIIITIILFLSVTGFSQFQVFSDYEEAAFGYFELSYRQDISGNIQAHSKGFGLECGINVAKGINEKMNLVPYGGIGFGWGAKSRNDFLIDFNRYGVYTEDGIIEDMRKIGLNDKDGGKSVYFNYGLLFKAPTKYSPVLALYGKFQMTSVGHSNSMYVNESGSDVGYTRSGRGIELRIPIQRNFYFGMYYDSFNFKNAKTQKNPGTRIEDCVTQEYFDKNGNRENVVGFRIGINSLMLK